MKNIQKREIRIEGKRYTPSDIYQALHKQPANFTGFQLELFRFLEDWFSASPEITIQTSGSTGNPKPMSVQKKYLRQSAEQTCSYLNLKALDKILLCMPLNFIAGKMMVVRAIVAGLDLYLVEPTGRPLEQLDLPFRFVSMVPLQIYNTLQHSIEKERLEKIEILLIGGAAIDPDLERCLTNFPNTVFASYGMAETVSHIALRRVNGPTASNLFSPLPSVTVCLSEEHTLQIHAPMVSSQVVQTNDLAEIFPDGRFRILGRKDNVVITGGLKVQVETLEALIGQIVKVPFAITSQPDPKFGEMLILVVEQSINKDLLTNQIPAYQLPKKVLQIRAIPRTESGKVNRAKLRQMVAELLSKDVLDHIDQK